MSDIFVDNIKHQSSQGSGTITLGASGEKIDLGATAGGTLSSRPNFLAFLTANQTITNVTWTKVQFDSEVYDADSVYDNSTNYRFTVPSGKAGKYLIHYKCRLSAVSNDNMIESFTGIYKNGSQITQNTNQFNTNYIKVNTIAETYIIDLAVNDYIEIFAYINDTSGSPRIDGSTTLQRTHFGATRLIGA